ncbi:MAG: hypothetical protein IJP90_11960 [Treponema sp.]|nr:hypothetical protein [Treponema sp.]
MSKESKSKELTVAQLKKRLAEFEKDAIIDLIADLYKSTPAVKQVLNLQFTADYGQQLLDKAEKQLDKIFFPEDIIRTGVSLKEAKAVVSNFTKVCADDELIARLNYHFAKNAVEFTNEFGDIDTPFYNALARHFANVTDIIARHPNLYDEFMPKLENLKESTSDCGWGVYYELSDILDRVRR